MILKEKRYEYIFLFLVTVSLAVLFINRLCYGIETSDEAFYAVTGYRLLKGNIPFGDMWELNATDGYIMLPFLCLRSYFVEGNEGLQLYLRVCAFALNVLGFLAVYFYAKMDLEKRYAYLLGLLYLFYAPFQLCSFSYNNLSILFFTVSICMLLTGLERKCNRFFLLSGISMALAILVYPSMLYCCIIFALIIIFFNRNKDGIVYLANYATGGIAIAAPVVIHLLSKVGFSELYTNMGFIMSAESTPSLSMLRIAKSFARSVLYCFTPFVENGLLFCVYWLVMAFCAFVSKLKPLCKFFVLVYPLICCICSISFNSLPVMNYIFSLFLIGPIAILLASDKKRMFRKFALEWGLSVSIYIVIAFSSGGGVRNAIGGLIFSTIVSLKLVIEALKDVPSVKYEKHLITAGILLSIFSEILLFYCGFYREDRFFELTDRIETGVYKGIYTTRERKQHIHDLEGVMKQVEEKDETVMILYHCVDTFLMVDMIPKIPSTWGCIDYQVYGYDNEQCFMDYLSIEANIPENILIVDIPEEYDYALGKVERYEPYYPRLNNYIDTHYEYVGTFEKGESGTVKKYEVNWESY